MNPKRVSIGVLCVAAWVVGCVGPTPQWAPPPYAVAEPLDIPRRFAEGRITTVNGIAFAPDGRRLYVSQYVDAVGPNGRPRARLFRSVFIDGAWTPPEPVFAAAGAYTDYQPVLSPDGQRLFFNSTRPVPGSDGEADRQNIWVAEWTETGWSVPRYVDLGHPESYNTYPSVTSDGTLYFNSDRAGGAGAMDFYWARAGEEGYDLPKNLESLNTADSENDLVIDPDGRFLIFNRYIFETEEVDLFVSFREEEAWGAPRPLRHLNTDQWELSPSLGPQGDYFFFQRDGVIFQIDIAALFCPTDPYPEGRAQCQAE